MPSCWIIDLRAAIRPTFIVLAMIIIFVDLLMIKVDLPDGIRTFFLKQLFHHGLVVA